MLDQFEIGTITGSHGIKGDIKVYPTTDDPQRFRQLKSVLVNIGGSDIEYKVSGVKYAGNFVVLHLDGFHTPEEIRPLRGKVLKVRREDAIALPPGQYFIGDLIGMAVYTDDSTSLLCEVNDETPRYGTLTDVIRTGANDVYEITRGDGGQILLPVIDDCVLDVNVEDARILVHILPGLEDL